MKYMIADFTGCKGYIHSRFITIHRDCPVGMLTKIILSKTLGSPLQTLSASV